jgi:hypothetical protein
VKQLEMMVKDFLDKHEFMSLYSYTDTIIPCSGILRRPDFLYLDPNDTYGIIIEVDEHAHRYNNRDCEVIRVSEILDCNGVRGKPLFLIRINPLKTCLDELLLTFEAFRTCRKTPETPMLTVAFIGYKKYEYDLADEMERVARERAAVGVVDN